MANSGRTQSGTRRAARRNVEPDVNPLETLEVFYETNKQTINTIVTVVLVVVVGYFAYTRLYKAPNEEKAATALSYPQLYFQADSLNMALNGDGQHLGFARIAKKYSNTAAGNLANYYGGLCYMEMGDFKNAINCLKEFDGQGTMLGYQAWGALGEAYMDDGQTVQAIQSFKKATENKDNTLVTPLYLYQLGMAYEASGNTNEAKTAFKRIRDEYPRSLQARDIDKELARLGEIN